MRASELRSGNFIKLFKNGKPHLEWYELDSHDIYKLDESNCEDVEPIPLTEEWLLKFGFEKDVYDNERPFYYTFKGFRLNCNLGFLTLHNSNDLADFNPIKIKYVHQLQNMLFALCGEELELKEPFGKSE